MIEIVEYEAPNSEKCSGCEKFDVVATVPWRMCTHPGRYEIDEAVQVAYDSGGLSIPDNELRQMIIDGKFGDKLPEEYTDKGCPLKPDRMFKTIIGNNKTAEVEFRDQQKYRSLPGLALPAICFLDEYLTKDMKVFEWGSGASTIFFGMRCANIASVEHSDEWCKKIGESMAYRMQDDIDYGYLIVPNDGFDPDYSSGLPGYESVNFKRYVTLINRFDDDFFDVILVDGRSRVACLKAAQPKLKPGGLLILDDSQRIKYHRTMAEIDWPVIHFEGCIPYYKHGRTVRTTIWVKE